MAAMDEATKRQIIELYESGDLTVSEISRQIGRAPSTIYWILQQNGIMPSRSRRHGAATDGDAPRQGTLQWALARVAELERENGQLQAQLHQAEAAFQMLLQQFVAQEQQLNDT